jgi:hypothetical protein
VKNHPQKTENNSKKFSIYDLFFLREEINAPAPNPCRKTSVARPHRELQRSIRIS